MMRTLLPLVTVLLLVNLAKGWIDRRDEFSQAFAKYAEQDGLASESPRERRIRYQAFNEFADMVERINADDDLPYTAEKNFFSILTEEERKVYLGFNATGHESESSSDNIASSHKVTASSRDFSNKISGIKNQGRCGSCWTFGATAALEGEIYFTTGKTKVSLSEQEYMECSTTRDGCQGGWMKWCYAYSASKDRIASTEAAPYKGRDSKTCNYENVANALKTTNTKVTGNIEFKGDENLLAYAEKHIVSVAIYVGGTFMGYKEGVYKDSTCNRQPNHAVAVVGYGKLDNRNYWKVRNSWGTGWGNKGYVLMDRVKQNMCMISTYSHIPEVKCRNGGCKAPNPDDGDDNDDGDDGDDGSNDKWCWVKKSVGKCQNSEAAVRKECEGNKLCAVTKIKKCYYATSDKKKGKNFVKMYIPCSK